AAPASDRGRAGRRLDPPSDARADDLDPDVRRDLRGLAPATAERVARHLVAAGRLLDEEPRQALAHARAARALAGRVAAVREAAGLAAYHVGEFTEALAELRTARRLDGSPRHLPAMADAERGLGRPERALALAADPAAARLDAAGRVELLVVASGARRDLGQPDAALVTLQGPDLDSPTVRPWTPRLWYAYAEALLAAGRVQDAVDWFDAVATVDEGETDAAGRAAALRTSAEDGADTRA
ncbi:MAG TPA: hypothetical protein VKP11_08755, partial [Frankiaceae bacterium]|nr:hypothetical protein [Frankiaceae bacterium]